MAAGLSRARFPGSALAVAMAFALAGCDPCTGVVGCENGPQVSFNGRVLDDRTGRGVGGVEVSFTRTGGVALRSDGARASTDADGFFRLGAEAQEPGVVEGTIALRPSGPQSGYAIPGARFETAQTRGAGRVLPTFLLEPRISFIGELQDLRGGGRVTYGDVIFIRRGGARLARDTVRTSVDPSGRFYMYMPALDGGDATGEIVVANSSLSREYRFDATLPVLVNYRLPQLDRIWAVGTSLYVSGVLTYAGGSRPVAGATVEFRRTGGIPLRPGQHTSDTNAEGVFTLAPLPADQSPGEVVGELVARLPGVAAPYTFANVRIPTLDFEPPTSRRIGTFALPIAPPAAVP